MLQWMGGSRRKITTSRQSTHKRQKQYFEQRKRQRQRQPEHQANADSAADGATPGHNHRSLDVLCLHNLTQQNHSVCTTETDRFKGHGSAFMDRFGNDTPATSKYSIADEISIRCGETGPLPECQLEGVPTEREAFTVNQGKPLNDNMGNSWVGPAENISVLDLLGDDQSNEGLESDPSNEDHVAFSLCGLGKVGTESPFCSPQCDSRKCSYEFPSSMKNSDNLDLLKDPDQHLHDFDTKVDNMIKGVDFFSDWNSYGFSAGAMERRNTPDWKEPYRCDHMDLNCKDGGGTTSSGWRKFHHSFNNSGATIWDSSPLHSFNQRSPEEADWSFSSEEHSRLVDRRSGSEESCSSSAVKGQGMNNLSLNSNWRDGNRKHGTACCSPGCSVGEARRNIWMPKPSRKTSMCSIVFPSEEKSVDDDSFVEKGYQSDHGNVNFSPFCGASNRKKDSAAKQKEHLWKVRQDPFKSSHFDYEVYKGNMAPITTSQEPIDDINHGDSIRKSFGSRNAESMKTTICLDRECRNVFITADSKNNPSSAEPNDRFWRERLEHIHSGQENVDCNLSHKAMMLESCVLQLLYACRKY